MAGWPTRVALWRHLVVDLHINIRVTFARVSWGQKLDGYTSHVDRARLYVRESLLPWRPLSGISLRS